MSVQLPADTMAYKSLILFKKCIVMMYICFKNISYRSLAVLLSGFCMIVMNLSLSTQKYRYPLWKGSVLRGLDIDLSHLRVNCTIQQDIPKTQVNSRIIILYRTHTNLPWPQKKKKKKTKKQRDKCTPLPTTWYVLGCLHPSPTPFSAVVKSSNLGGTCNWQPGAGHWLTISCLVTLNPSHHIL